jgi:hypothetical protein
LKDHKCQNKEKSYRNELETRFYVALYQFWGVKFSGKRNLTVGLYKNKMSISI